MIRDHFARHHKTHRATELDPATFDHAEDWQREEAREKRLCLAFPAIVGVSLLVAAIAAWR